MGKVGAHPLLIPLIFLDSEVREATDRLESHHHKLDHLAKRSGQYEWSGHPLPDPLESDFVSVTRQLTLTSRSVSSDIWMVRSIISALEQASQWELSLDLQRNSTSSCAQHSDNDLGYPILTTRLEYIRNRCNTLLLEAECLKSSVQDLIQAVSLASLLLPPGRF
jgi:hypothetical protein